MSPAPLVDLCAKALQAAGARGLTIATAESCTGGLLAAMLTDVEGQSRVFERGFVCYSPEAKGEMLGVARDLISAKGAVSEPVAVAMATGALDRSRADIAIAITGFAGPAGPDDEEGLVHIVLAQRGGSARRLTKRYGAIGRDGVRDCAARDAITLLCAAVTDAG